MRPRATFPSIVVSILDEKPRGMSLGAADYLIKPVARDALVGALRRVGAVAPAQASTGTDRESVPSGGVP